MFANSVNFTMGLCEWDYILLLFFSVFLQTQILAWKRIGHNPGLVAHSTVNGEEQGGTVRLVYASGKLRFFPGSDMQRTVNPRIILLINCPTLISILCSTCK